MFVEGRDGLPDGDGPEFVPWFVCNGIGCDRKVFDQDGDCPVHEVPLVEVDEHGREVT